VRLVALTVLLEGILSVVQILMKLPSGRIELSTGPLYIITYFGLRRFSPWWRTWALFWCWVGMLAGPLLLVAFLVNLTLPYDIPIRTSVPLPIVGLWSCLNIWQYRLLTRPDVRALFYPQPQPASLPVSP
jgi:hypothetical protein